MAHKSLRMQDQLWERAAARAVERGFVSTNEYIRFLIKEDLETQLGLEQLESSLVSSMSKLGARLTSLGTMNQALFAVLWELAELVLTGRPERDQRTEEQMQQFRLRVARSIRGNSTMRTLLDETAPTAQA